MLDLILACAVYTIFHVGFRLGSKYSTFKSMATATKKWADELLKD
jgi:hypothetical protein